MSRSRQIYYMVEYAIVWPFLKLLRLLPFRLRIAIGGRVLRTVLNSLKSARDRIDGNLRKIMPDLSDTERHAIRKKVGHTFGRTIVEILNNDTYTKQTHLFHASGPGLQAIKDRPSGTGFILVSGHFGAWDAPRHYLKGQGIEVGAIYRPSNNMYFDRIFLKQIGFGGQPIFAKGRRGTMEMVKHVRGGGAVAILLDQKYKKGEMLDFLGHPASTSLAAAEMALKYNVPFIPVYGVRRDDSLDVDIVFEAPIPPTDARTMSQAANDSLGAMVRKHPGQWYWLHQRWRKGR